MIHSNVPKCLQFREIVNRSTAYLCVIEYEVTIWITFRLTHAVLYFKIHQNTSCSTEVM